MVKIELVFHHWSQMYSLTSTFITSIWKSFSKLNIFNKNILSRGEFVCWRIVVKNHLSIGEKTIQNQNIFVEKFKISTSFDFLSFFSNCVVFQFQEKIYQDGICTTIPINLETMILVNKKKNLHGSNNSLTSFQIELFC